MWISKIYNFIYYLYQKDITLLAYYYDFVFFMKNISVAETSLLFE